jgi:hypothetical protein
MTEEGSASEHEHDRVCRSTTAAAGIWPEEPAAAIDLRPKLRRELGTVHDVVES